MRLAFESRLESIPKFLQCHARTAGGINLKLRHSPEVCHGPRSFILKPWTSLWRDSLYSAKLMLLINEAFFYSMSPAYRFGRQPPTQSVLLLYRFFRFPVLPSSGQTWSHIRLYTLQRWLSFHVMKQKCYVLDMEGGKAGKEECVA